VEKVMADVTSDTSRVWKMISGALAVTALGAAVFGYLQYRAADRLAAQLAAATQDAQLATQEETSLRTQLSAAQDRTNSQAEKLTAAEQQVNREEQQLAATENEMSEKQQQLHSAEARLAAGSRQDLPIRLSFHRAMFGNSKAAVLQNVSDDDLEVLLDVQSPVTGAHTRRRLLVNAHSLLRVGPAQGLPFAPGEVVTLVNSKFRPVVQTVT
jgi:outer membrane receptor for ferrienterochelin and colicin